MKKLIWFLLALVTSVATLTLGSCDRVRISGGDRASDSSYVVELYNSIANPSFSTVEEVVVYRDLQVEKQQMDSIFLNIPQETLETVAKVVINKHGKATAKSIVQEFLLNQKQVYQYIGDIPDKTAPVETEDTILTQPD